MKICPTYMVAQCQDGSSPRPIIGTCQFEACPETMPQGKACTMEVRLCPDGFTAMARDQSCGWHPESCPAGTGTSGMKCLVDSTTGKTSCGVQSAPTY